MNRNSQENFFAPGVFSVVVTVACALFFWLATYYFSSEPKLESFAYWDAKIYEQNGWLPLLLSFVICLSSAFLLNRFVNRFAIIRTQTALPGLFLVLFVGADKALQTNASALFGLFILIISLWQLLLMHYRKQEIRSAFNIMLLMTAASFACFELVYLIPLFFIGFLMFQSFGGRVFISALLGVFTAVLMLTSAFFLFDGLEALQEFVLSNLWLQFQPRAFDIAEMVYYSFLFFLLLIAIIHVINSFHKEKNQVRRSFEYFFVCIFALLALYVFRAEFGSQIITLASLFGSLFLAYLFSIGGGLARMFLLLYILFSFAYFVNHIFPYSYLLW